MVSIRRFIWAGGAAVVLLSAVAVGAVGTSPPAAAAFSAGGGATGVYVIDQFSFSVSQFAIAAGGLLSPLSPPTVATGAAPFDVVVSPDGKSAYVTNTGDEADSVSQYDINPLTGALSPKTPATVAAGGNPEGIAVTPDGRSAYVTNGSAIALGNTVSQYDINPLTGALSPKTPATIAAAAGPYGLVVSPDGRSAYATNSLGDTISQYNIDPVTGALSPKTPATVITGLLPSEMAVTPDGESLYVTTDSTGVYQYNIDPVTGVLSPKTPATVGAGIGALGVAVTPDGKSAYVTSLFTGIFQYNIDPLTGVLSPKTPATVAAGAEPYGVAVTPDGKSAYVTNLSDGIFQYNIDPLTGALSPKTPATVATAGTRIAVGPLPKAAPTSTTLTSTPAVEGQTTTLTATVRPGSGGGTPTGSVTFADMTAGKTLGSAALRGGVASLKTVFSEEGSHAITASYGGDANFHSSSTAKSISVADAPLTGQAPPAPLQGREGVPFFAKAIPVSGVVGSFTDADPAGTASDYSATIAWGDGTTSVGTISASGSGFPVTGSHTYKEDRNYPITVHIADVGGSTVAVNSSAHVSEPRNFLAFLVDLFFERFGF